MSNGFSEGRRSPPRLVVVLFHLAEDERQLVPAVARFMREIPDERTRDPERLPDGVDVLLPAESVHHDPGLERRLRIGRDRGEERRADAVATVGLEDLVPGHP